MKRALLVLAGVALVFTTAQAGQTGKDDAERLLKAAQNTEVVDGNPRAAIKQYQVIVDRFSKSDRATAATALLRMAECYRKLGEADAQRILQQLVRDYADQPAAVAQARARLNAASGSVPQSGTVQRQVWAGESHQNQYGGISQDGRWLLYTYNSGPTSEADKWGLHIRDLSSGISRKLVASTFPTGREQPDARAALSRDNQRVAYGWLTDRGIELRTVSVNGPAAPPRVLVGNDDFTWIAAHDWTPDGRFIAVTLVRKDKTGHIGVVSSIDGSVRVLKSVNWDDNSRLCFSPDGKYLAFGQRDPDDRTGDIYVVAIDGSREFPAVVFRGSDSVIGWSGDGRQLLFLSERTGSFGVWSQPFSDGPSGVPKPIKSDVGGLDVIGFTAAGAMYYATKPPDFQSDLKFASIALAEGRVVSQPVVAVEEHVGTNNNPQWSHDGKRWAYVSRRPAATVIVIRSADDNRIITESRLKERRAESLQWAPDGRSLTIDGELDGRMGVLRIDAQTGMVAPIVMQPPGGGVPPRHRWSVDGKTLYFQSTTSRATVPGTVALVAFDVASKRETEIMRVPNERMARTGTNYALSPDGRTLYFTRLVSARNLQEAGGRAEIVARDFATSAERTLWDGAFRDGDLSLSPDGRHIVRNSTTTNQWMLVPTSGGEPRPLMSFPGTPRTWSADGRAVIVSESAPSSVVWFVPVDGRQPKKLDIELEQTAFQFTLHPDGRRLVFNHSIRTGTQNRLPGEVWVIENLLPRAAPSRK